MGDSSDGVDSEIGVATGRSGDTPSLGGSLSTRVQKRRKRSVKDLSQDEGMMSRLREKIRHQRLVAASSTETSMNESFASSFSQSEVSRDATPQHTVREADETDSSPHSNRTSDAHRVKAHHSVSHSEIQETASPIRNPTTTPTPATTTTTTSRKLLAPNLQMTVNQVNRLTSPRRKGCGASVHKSSDAGQTIDQAVGRMLASASASSVCPPVPSGGTEELGAEARRRGSAPSVLSAGRKKPVKPGGKNTITTSSWRAGQELVARELGQSKTKRGSGKNSNNSNSNNLAQTDNSNNSSNITNVTTTATATVTNRHNLGLKEDRKDDVSRSVKSAMLRSSMAGAGSLRESLETVGRLYTTSMESQVSTPMETDSKKSSSDHLIENKGKGSASSATKRKASKEEAEQEKGEQTEKQRHYNSQSVRQFMAKQKAQRHKQREDSRKAEQRDRQKRQQLLQELVNRQRSAALPPPTKAKKGKEADRHKQNSGERHRSVLSDPQASTDGEGSPMEIDNDNSDADTLTGESEEGSTPRASAFHNRQGAGKPTPTTTTTTTATTNNADHSNSHSHPHPHPGLTSPTSSATLPTPTSSSKPIQFQGKTLSMDVDSALSRFSRVVSQRQGQGGGGGGRGGGGAGALDRGVEVGTRVVGEEGRRREERLQALRTSSQDLQSKIASASARLSASPSAGGQTTAEDRSTSMKNKSSRPGVPNSPSPAQRDSSAPTRCTASSSAASTLATVEKNNSDRPENSTGISAGKNLPAQRDVTKLWKPPEKRQPQKPRAEDTDKGGFAMDVQYRAPTGGNVRRGPPRPDRLRSSGPSSPLSATAPMERSTSSKLASGVSQKTRDRTTHNRDKTSLHLSLPLSPEGHDLAGQDNLRKVVLVDKGQESVYAPPGGGGSLDCGQERRKNATLSCHDLQQVMKGVEGQRTDAGQDTDSPRSLSEEDSPLSARAEGGDRSWSPAAFERQMAAELARLENLEDSIRRLSNAERTRAIALAQKETVSVAQVLRAGQEAHSAELRTLQLQVQEERLASAQQLQQLSASQGSRQAVEGRTSGGPDAVKTGTSSSADISSPPRVAAPFHPATTLSSLTTAGNSRPVRTTPVRGDTDSPLTVMASSEPGNSLTVHSHLSTPLQRFSGAAALEPSLHNFTTHMVRNIMREEEMRAQQQEALLRLRAQAVKEKTQAQLSLLQQERQQVLGKGGVGGGGTGGLTESVQQQRLQRVADREQAILMEEKEHQAEIQRMFRSEELAREHRQSLLKQHEQIAQMQKETQQKMRELQGRLGSQADDEGDDDSTLMEDLSDTSQVSLSQDSTSQSTQQKMEKQQRLHLDQKYLTSREQKLRERRKQAAELLRWKRNLDAEEEKVRQLEQSALEAWEGRGSDKSPGGRVVAPGPGLVEGGVNLEGAENKVRAPGNRRPEPGTPRAVGTSAYATTPTPTTTTTPPSPSSSSRAANNNNNNGGTADSTLDPLGSVVMAVEGEEGEGQQHKGGKRKSPVGRLLPPGNSPLPQPWSHKTGSESESEESVSHTETQSDVSDYEVRIRHLSDMLRRRRKEADMLKKERSKRMKDKLKEQEESLKKQLEAYEIFISRVKTEQTDLEQEAGGRPTVPPKIKQPGQGAAGRTSPGPPTSPLQGLPGHRQDDAVSGMEEEKGSGLSSSVEEPAGKETKLSTLDEKNKGRTHETSPKTSLDRADSSSPLDRSRPDTRKPRNEKSAIPRSTSRDGEKSVTASSVSPFGDRSGMPQSERENSGIPRANLGDGDRSQNKSRDREKSGIPVSGVEKPSGDKTKEIRKSGIPRSTVRGSEKIDMVQNKSPDTRSISPALDSIDTPLLPSGQGSKDSMHGDPDHAEDKRPESPSQGRGRKQSRIPLSLRGDVSPSLGRTTPRSELSPVSPSSRTPFMTECPPGQNLDTNTSPTTDAVVSPTSPASQPVTGIQESDSESDSRLNRTHSRPSSERSTASTTFSDLHDFDEEEEAELLVCELEGLRERDRQGEITHHSQEGGGGEVSVGEDYPSSLSRSWNDQTAGRSSHQVHVEVTDRVTDDDPTPTHTPRSDRDTTQQAADDLQEGDRVRVDEHLQGTLRFKGHVHFARGLWGGVELDRAEGDTDGRREGKRYFTCRPDHGLLVPLTRISPPGREKGTDGAQVVVNSPDSSKEEEATFPKGKRSSELHTSPSRIPERKKTSKEPTSLLTKTRDLDLMADDITDDLSRSLIEDSMETINAIASRHCPSNGLDKAPVASSTLETILSKPLTKAKAFEDLDHEDEEPKTSKTPSTDKALSAGINGLIEASSLPKLKQVRRSRFDSQDSTDSATVNGSSDYDSGVDRSYDTTMDHLAAGSPEPGGREADDDVKGCVSPELNQRSGSSGLADSALQEEPEYDFSGLTTEDDFFVDDEFGVLGKPSLSSRPSVDDLTDGHSADGQSSAPVSQTDSSAGVFIIPHQRSEVDAIVASALSVYWNLRRCGEPWDTVTPPQEYLTERSSDRESNDSLVTGSRRTFRHLVFDLTGEIVRDIYQQENAPEPPPWQKTTPRRWRYSKGTQPPTTMEVLLPVVQTTVGDLLGLSSLSSGRLRGQSANRWSLRKKKDPVDAVLVEELQQEEGEWVNYSHDELSVKLQLTNTLFDSLLEDTVSTVSKVYSRRQLHWNAS